MTQPATDRFAATGRRKTAVARVRVRAGEGKIVVNKRPFEQYFNGSGQRNLSTGKRQQHHRAFQLG